MRRQHWDVKGQAAMCAGQRCDGFGNELDSLFWEIWMVIVVALASQDDGDTLRFSKSHSL